MTKWSGLKKAVMAMMAVGMLCACGNNAQPENGATDPELSSEPSITEEPTIAAETEQENNPVIGDIVTEDVENVSVRFYIGYNIATGDVISDVIPSNTMEVNGEDLAKLSEILTGWFLLQFLNFIVITGSVFEL